MGATTWAIAQATGSRSASDFGGNAVKDEAKSEAWDIGGTIASKSSNFGEHFSTFMGVVGSGFE